MNKRDLERCSSAVTLSDMEVFIFPELMYALLLANLMSPRIWQWRGDSWFDGLERIKPYRRISRLKQYIMDHYVFNLDLDTWGLTTKEREIARFREFIDTDTLARSNALFGYEGDRYYFDIDIRTHFGLDKYTTNVVPYWKTETVEAMDAFRFKPNYNNGAGECVSLAALYAASMFLVARIPLADIFMIATPLHSQNFVDVDEGILTNNRRLVTRNMWFNGTALSAQARRALENERVTIVTHETGFIHTIYPEATISPEAYARFSGRLRSFLHTALSEEILGNFLRHHNEIQRCFQVRWPRHGVDHYVPIERVFAYEHGGPYLLTDNTRDKLMTEVESEEFQCQPLAGRIVFNDLERFVRENRIDIDKPDDVTRLKEQFSTGCLNAARAIDALIRFCRVSAQLPEAAAKRFQGPAAPLGIDPDMTREDVIERVESLRDRNEFARLAFHAYRDLNRVEAEPFVLAAIQRNPVAVAALADKPDAEVEAAIRALPEASIYDGDGRLAQPDEVWNFGRGDGLEKALLLANILRSRRPGAAMRIEVGPSSAVLESDATRHEFTTGKNLREQVWEIPAGQPAQ